MSFLQTLHCFLHWQHKNWFLLSGVYAGIIVFSPKIGRMVESKGPHPPLIRPAKISWGGSPLGSQNLQHQKGPETWKHEQMSAEESWKASVLMAAMVAIIRTPWPPPQCPWTWLLPWWLMLIQPWLQPWLQAWRSLGWICGTGSFLRVVWWFFRLFIICWVLVCWEFLLHSFPETLTNIILQAKDIKILPKLSPCTWEFRFGVASSQDSSDQDYPDFL